MNLSKKITSLTLIVFIALNFSLLINFTSAKTNKGANHTLIPNTVAKQLHIKTFSGPDTALSMIHNSIVSATKSFYLEIYTLSKESLINDLIAINSSGVEVIILLSHDHVSGYENNYTAEAAKRLYEAGIEVLWTSSTFRYTHAKFWVVDHDQVGIYSGNWAPTSVPDNVAKGNREFGVIIYDSEVAALYESVFFNDLAIGTPYSPITTNGKLAGEPSSGSYDHPFSYATFDEYMEVTPVFSPDNSYDQISSMLARATSTIDVELQYILHDNELLQDLISAALRGVRVRVIVNEPDDAPGTGNNVTDELLANGIGLTYFDSNLQWNHNKYVCIDNEEILIASINWSNNSLTNNREAGIIIKNANVAAFYQEIFEYDWTHGEFVGGNIPVVNFVKPIAAAVMSENYEIQASFSGTNFTSGELKIDGNTVKTWTKPIGLVSTTIDTTALSNGIHELKLVGYPVNGTTLEKTEKVNVINVGKWLLLITEVRYNAVSEPGGEFFEIYNGFSFAVTISSWSFTDNEAVAKVPENTIIDAGQVMLFVRDLNTFYTETGDLGISGITPDFTYSGISLSNTGDELIFKDASDIIRDAVAWGSGSVSGVVSWSGTCGEDETLQRIPANEDTNNCNTDFKAAFPTPGKVTTGGTETTPTQKETESNTNPLPMSIAVVVLSIASLAALVKISKRIRT